MQTHVRRSALRSATRLALAGIASLAACSLAACSPRAGDDRPPAADSATGVEAPALADADPAHALFGCLVGDSAAYAAADSGVRLTLWHAGDGVDGSATRADGDASESTPLARVRVAGADSIELDVPGPERDAAARDTTFFAGRVACDSLWGRERSTRDARTRAIAYRRVR